jgi:hypothetical protein
MKAHILKPGINAVLGLLLVAPAFYFILINILNEFGSPALYNTSIPLLESLGLQKSFGWNINLLIVFGPALAFILNASSIIAIEWKTRETDFEIEFNIQRKTRNWFVIVLSGLCLFILFAYLFLENYN